MPVCVLLGMCRLRLDVLKWNGWGYKDSGFVLNEKNEAIFQGRRYAGHADKSSIALQ